MYSITISDDVEKDSRLLISILMSKAKQQINEKGLTEYTVKIKIMSRSAEIIYGARRKSLKELLLLLSIREKNIQYISIM